MHKINSFTKYLIEFKLIIIHIGVNSAVNTIKNIDIPSTANIEGPKIGSKL